MHRDYIHIPKPPQMPRAVHALRAQNDDFWKTHIFYHVLDFCASYDKNKVAQLILNEHAKERPRLERAIARFLRTTLKNSRAISNAGFVIVGEVTNDNDVEGNYDIVIYHSFWTNKKFPFECKNLYDTNNYINQYVYVNNPSRTDGGVYRFFNGKYAQEQGFGGMIGFVLGGDLKTIKRKIQLKLTGPFDISPEGDLKEIVDSSINHDECTFTSIHNRKSEDFRLYHILVDMV